MEFSKSCRQDLEFSKSCRQEFELSKSEPDLYESRHVSRILKLSPLQPRKKIHAVKQTFTHGPNLNVVNHSYAILNFFYHYDVTFYVTTSIQP